MNLIFWSNNSAWYSKKSLSEGSNCLRSQAWEISIWYSFKRLSLVKEFLNSWGGIKDIALSFSKLKIHHIWNIQSLFQMKAKKLSVNQRKVSTNKKRNLSILKDSFLCTDRIFIFLVFIQINLKYQLLYNHFAENLLL